MVSAAEIQSLVDGPDALLGQLTAIGDLRPGTLQARYRRCGKPNYRCAREGDPGHRAQVGIDQHRRGQDAQLDDFRASSGHDAGADRGVPAPAMVDARVDRGER